MLNTNHTFTNELNKRAAPFVDHHLSAEAKDCAARCEILKVEFCVKTGTICLTMMVASNRHGLKG